MGVSGLLPLLKDIVEHTHVSKLAGRWVGVDTYSWFVYF